MRKRIKRTLPEKVIILKDKIQIGYKKYPVELVRSQKTGMLNFMSIGG